MMLLPYPVSANRYWRTFRGMQVVSKEARAYKQEVAWTWMLKKGGRLGGPVSVRIELLPKLTKKGEASKTRMDLDNAIKITLDALNNVAYGDDSQIVHIDARYGKAIEGGGLRVAVEGGDVAID